MTSGSPGRPFIGTSGWAYTSWKPLFYPQEVRSAEFLRYYATRLATLEVNYTFNHLPTAKNISGWQEATPPPFVFALKASQQITHVRQLRDPAESLPIFFERARPLALRLVGMHCRRGDAFVFKMADDSIGTVLGARENQY